MRKESFQLLELLLIKVSKRDVDGIRASVLAIRQNREGINIYLDKDSKYFNTITRVEKGKLVTASHVPPVFYTCLFVCDTGSPARA